MLRNTVSRQHRYDFCRYVLKLNFINQANPAAAGFVIWCGTGIMRAFRSWLHLFNTLGLVDGKCSNKGLVAQSVEQRIENPCVGGSIPPRATRFFWLVNFLMACQEYRQAFLFCGYQACPKI
jgi:hypothetical protein